MRISPSILSASRTLSPDPRRACTDDRQGLRRAGFTIIELLAVVLIISILAGIAISKFGQSKRRAFISTMRTDLRNIASMAEAQFTTDNSYTAFTAPQGSEGVTLTFTGTLNSWTATATHVGVPGMTCSMGNGPLQTSEPVCQ